MTHSTSRGAAACPPPKPTPRRPAGPFPEPLFTYYYASLEMTSI